MTPRVTDRPTAPAGSTHNPRHVRLVYPHQLFLDHLDAPSGTRFVLVEDDLLLRQYEFHVQKRILHRASMTRFATRLRKAGFDVDVVRSEAQEPTGRRLVRVLERLRPTHVTVYDVVDDWLFRDCSTAVADAGCRLRPEDVLESPNFVTTRAELRRWFAEHPARMQHFYTWQRLRLDVLVDGSSPLGGRWSFDTDNRKKLPRGVAVPTLTPTPPDKAVREAIDWVREEFPDAPGEAEAFAWPTSHEEAEARLREFLHERLAQFGPYEDAISNQHPYLFHAAISGPLNVGLLAPAAVVQAALNTADGGSVPLASLEGFVRQVIGWREYMRATYQLWGRKLRTGNQLRHARPLERGWWTGETGLDPVDHVIQGVLHRGWAHHIERLMVLGNAMCLLRTDPNEAYEWFMELFIDAYDWVMVPNVYAMSQFASGGAITTKPYVSSSNYLRKMSDFPAGPWTTEWDSLFWAFVHDHRGLFEGNPRLRMMPRVWEAFDESTKAGHLQRAQRWLGH